MKGAITPLVRFLAAGHVAALALLMLASAWPLPDIDVRQVDGVVADLETAAPTASAHDIDEILERPIFHAGRRKPAVVQETAQAVVTPRALRMPFQLMGILGSGTGHTAYLFNQDTQETISVNSGSQAGAWRVVDVSDSTVTLEAGDAVRTLRMADGG